MTPPTITLDVREDIRSGREPFSKIMNAAAGLRAGEELLVIAPFEPVPLFHALARQGFRHVASANSSGDWEVRFTRDAQSSDPAKFRLPTAEDQRSRAAGASAIELDARGLEPPQPLVRILEALLALPAGSGLRARTDRRPMHLYPHLEQNGFTFNTEEQSDGSFVTHICRA